MAHDYEEIDALDFAAAEPIEKTGCLSLIMLLPVLGALISALYLYA